MRHNIYVLALGVTCLDGILVVQSRPVYIALPEDIVYEKVSAARLRTPLNREPPPNDPEVEASVIDAVYRLVKGVGADVVILLDGCALRHHIGAELKEFLYKTQFPVYTAPMGKTVINEDYPRFGGVRYRRSDRCYGRLIWFF